MGSFTSPLHFLTLLYRSLIIESMWVSATWLVYGLFCCSVLHNLRDRLRCSWDSHITFGVSERFWLSVTFVIKKFEFAQVSFGLPQCPFNTFQSICISFINSTPHILKLHGDVEPVQDTEELAGRRVKLMITDQQLRAPSASGSHRRLLRHSLLACRIEGVNFIVAKSSSLAERHSSCPLSLDDACQRCDVFWR